MKKTKFWMLSWAILLAAAVGFTACVDDDEDTEMPYLEVTPTALTFGEDGVALNGNTININTNRAWNITLLAADGDTVDPAEWITLSKYEGGGNSTVLVDVQAGTVASATAKITISNQAGPLKTAVVTITRGTVVPETIIYNETFGTNSQVENTNVDQYTDWTKSGTGAATVEYVATNASVRKSSPNTASSYNGASGAPILFFGAAPATFTVKNITLTAEQTNLKLTFGGQQTITYQQDYTWSNDNMLVALSADGNTWTNLEYTKNNGDVEKPNWILATANFTLKEATSSLYIRFTTANLSSNIRIDDITLATGNGGQVIDLASGIGGGGQEPTLPAVTLPTEIVTSFSDVFDGVSANKVIYESSKWSFFSNSTAYPATPTEGWMTGIFNTTDKYIQIAPYGSSLSEVVAYAVITPFNVKAAADKTLKLKYTWYYQTADDSKFEVVVSSTATNDNARDNATWTVVKDLTFASSQAKNEWVDASIDLSAYADVEKLYVALRYTGKSNTYRVDDVEFSGGASVPAVTTGATSDLTDKSVTLAGSSQNITAATEVGVEYIVYSDNINWTGATKKAATAVATSWTVAIDGLTAETKYAYRAYAVSGGTTIYGDVANFTTQSVAVATPVSITIPELLKKITSTSAAAVLDANTTYTFEGVICGDPKVKNCSFGTLYVMTPDATTGGNAVVLYNSAFYNEGNYALGDVVTVTLPAGVAKEQLRYSIPQITGIGVEHVVKKSSGHAVNPIKLTSVSEIANYYSMPVTIEVTTAESDVWMTGNANSTKNVTAGGAAMAIYFNKQAYETFTNVSYVATTAEITGIASVYSGTQQVCPRNLDDVAAFVPTTPTITDLTPISLTWTNAETDAKTITISGVNLDGVTLTPALSGEGAEHFTATISGTTITVTPKEANATTADITATLTVSAEGGNSKTATLTHSKPVVGGGTEKTVTFDFSTITETGTAATTTIDAITLTPEKGEASNAPGTNKSGEWRLYKASRLVVSGATITKIEITFTSTSYMGCDFVAEPGTYTTNDKVGTWTGSASSVTFQNGTTSSENVQARMKKIVVTYVE
ncbi:MAG: hypothetical protein E7148_07480 [Rikenellaceae bacterium]|nr:hypothetical protein [Rikenellaceae bacterium]